MPAPKRPLTFRLPDGPAYPGLTDDTRWNGFVNVWVRPATRDRIVRDLEAEAAACGYDRDDMVSGIDEIPVGEDGLVALAYGYATEEE